MNIPNKLVFFICILTNSFFLISKIDPVDHKNLQLNLYLDLIKYNTQEKLGVLPYILDNPDGIYLEIGTGGDPIADLLSKIPDTMSPTIIASDVDENILKSLPSRHPELNKYLGNKSTGPRLILKQLNAIEMDRISDNYLSGINASAIVHEIVSYSGGIKGLNKFFAESFRILKKKGVLIYRDPEGVTQKNELINVEFKTKSIRLFVHIFIVKLLDDYCGKLALSGSKYKHYFPDKITFTIYKKNESLPCKLTYEKYLRLRSYEIDFSREYTVCLPRGLCREIERHYLTYLHQCNPLVFIKCVPYIDSSSYFINYLAHSTSMIFEKFLQNNSLNMVDNSVDISTKRKIDTTIANNTRVLEYGIPLHFSSGQKERFLWNLLKQYNLDPSIYILPINDGDYLLDYRIFGLLYDHLTEKIFDSANGPINERDLVHAQWLQREGEETYTYYSTDELITQVAKISLEQNKDESEKLVLCPLSPDHNKFIPRLCYKEVLKDSMKIDDLLGYPIKIKEGKRIIHFGKIPLKNALVIYEDIITRDPQSYKQLQQFVEKLKNDTQSLLEDSSNEDR